MLFSSKKGKTALATLIVATLIVVLISILTSELMINADQYNDTKIVIQPVENTFYANETLPGSTFIVNATVIDVTDLQNWQIKLTWNSSLLDFVSISLPSDHVFAASGYAMITPPPDTGPGYVMWGCTYINIPYWTFNGTGTLCQIELEILTPPNPPPVTCNLTLTGLHIDTFLLNGALVDIPFSVEDGVFTYEDYLEASIDPAAVLVNYGENATFTVNALNGAEPYRYQWYFKYPNNTEIEVTGAENETSWTCYPIIETGTYRVTVKITDSAGGQVVVSATVQIRGLTVTMSPQSPVVDIGGTKTFTAAPSGGISPYKIQWYRNNTEVPTAENETVVTFTFNDAGKENVKVMVTDSGLDTSSRATDVTILPSTTTVVKVIPETATFYTNETLVGDKIVFNITIQDVSKLENWQINLTWDPTVLSYSNIWLPSDHVFAGAEAAGKVLFPVGPILDTGSIIYGCTYMNTPPYWTFNGTGTMCQVELEILSYPLSSCTVGLAEKYVDTFIVEIFGGNIGFSIENSTYTYVLVEHVTHDVSGYIVETHSNASILANSVLQSDGSLSFTVYGASGTAAYVNVTIPKALMDVGLSEWRVYLNGTDVTGQATITEDTDYTYIYLEFTFGSARMIEIVPELIHMLLILMITSLIAAILTKTSTKKK